jgi:hypothetical protein
VQVAAIARWMQWDDLGTDPVDVSGDEFGWGVHVSSNIKFGQDVLKLSVVDGEGISNYMNDATVDVGALGPGDPDIAEALPLLGIVAFYDRTWNERYTSTIGYSMIDIDTSDGQAPEAFEKGEYALANLMYYPVKNLMWGGEVQWGKRHNKGDGQAAVSDPTKTVESFDDLRFQVSVKYNFSHSLGNKS